MNGFSLSSSIALNLWIYYGLIQIKRILWNIIHQYQCVDTRFQLKESQNYTYTVSAKEVWSLYFCHNYLKFSSNSKSKISFKICMFSAFQNKNKIEKLSNCRQSVFETFKQFWLNQHIWWPTRVIYQSYIPLLAHTEALADGLCKPGNKVFWLWKKVWYSIFLWLDVCMNEFSGIHIIQSFSIRLDV